MEVQIVPYEPALQPYFEKFNKAWLEEYFTVEPIDKWVLENPEEAIIKNGGVILFAKDNDKVIGTVALKPMGPGVFELTKMAVDKEIRGKGAGQKLCKAAIEKAREMGANKVILYSSTLLENAISIYRKLGFQEIPLKTGTYGRADIMMELTLL